MGVTASIVGATVAIYGMYEQSKLTKNMQAQSQNQLNQMAATQAKQEKELKDRQTNEQSLENSKITRSRNQALAFGGATKNNTIKTTALGVTSAPSSGGTTLLGL